MSREALLFPSNLSPTQRREVHTLAHHMGLSHVSRGNGDQRQVHVFRPNTTTNAISPSFPPIPTTMPMESRPRGLRGSLTMDFNDTRGSDPGVYSAIGRHTSTLLDVPGSPNMDPMSRQNLRGAKSTADMRSYTPSPVPSTASFPPFQNHARFNDFGPTNGSPNGQSLNKTSSGGMLRDDAMLAGALSGMSLTSPIGNGMPSVLREQRSNLEDRNQQHSMSNVIGSGLSRNSFNNSYDEQSRNVSMPVRQPRGPGHAGPGFLRQPPSNNSNYQSGEDLDLGNGSRELIGA